jgi:ATP-dependent Clp protease protease subunit
MPKIIEEDINSSIDIIESGLLKSHTHFINGEINEDTIEFAIKWLLYENLENKSDKLLTLYINSPGGSLCDAFALIDLMKKSKYPVRTIGIGSIMSAAFLIFAAGQRGQRYIARNTSILCHQFSEDMNGKYHDIRAQMKESEHMNNRMVEFLIECTDLPKKTIKSKLLPPSDVWLTVEEVVELGVADHIL